MPSKNEIVDDVLRRNGRAALGQTAGSTGTKAALASIVDRFGLDLDTSMTKPDLGKGIVEAAGQEWLRGEGGYDSTHRDSGGGGTITKEGWEAVSRALDHLETAQAPDDHRAIDRLVRGREPPAVDDRTPRMTDAERRRAVERHAVDIATRDLEARGYEVVDVGDEASFDLLCHRDGEWLDAEVKGTTTAGEAVILTRNEVEHARTATTSLFVVDSIVLHEDGTTSDGTLRRIDEWVPDDDDLTATVYRYSVPWD